MLYTRINVCAFVLQNYKNMYLQEINGLLKKSGNVIHLRSLATLSHSNLIMVGYFDTVVAGAASHFTFAGMENIVTSSGPGSDLMKAFGSE